MVQPSSKRQKTGAGLKSSVLMSVSSSDEEEIQAVKEKVEIADSESEDGEIDELTELDALRAEGTAEFDAIVEKGLASGGRDVMQKDARYFMLDNVVCEHCGIKGHLSYDCTEEQEVTRCFICGKPGHSSKDCPQQVCFFCKETGHKFRDCPNRHGNGNGVNRRRRHVLPSRTPKYVCYVCGGDGHLDCSLIRESGAVMSCHNCGKKGHAGSGCNLPGADRVIPIVQSMENERRQAKLAAREGGKKRGRGGTELRNGTKRSKDGGAGDSKLMSMTPKEYREEFMERSRKTRYGKRDR